MNKIIGIFIGCIVLILSSTFVTSSIVTNLTKNKGEDITLEIEQMRQISELAVLECYYHNVTDTNEEGVEKFLFWEKDLHFWIEYDSIVKIGIDVSELDFNVKGSNITITLPEVKIVGNVMIDQSTLDEDSFYYDKRSIKANSSQQVAAYEVAEQNLIEEVNNDATLMLTAKTRIKSALKGYVDRIGEAAGIKYNIEWNETSIEN